MTIISNSLQTKKLISLFILFLPLLSFTQQSYLFVELFESKNETYENIIKINNEFIEFQNNELNIRMSKNYEVVDIQYTPLGIKWTGSYSSFQHEYSEYIKITTEANYNNFSKTECLIRDSLIRNFDAIIINDTVKSYNQFFSVSLLEYANGKTILGNNTTIYKPKNTDNKVDIWYGIKLNKENIQALANINSILQKLSISIDKMYSFNLNFINKNIKSFPLKVVKYGTNNKIQFQEEVTVIDTNIKDKTGCKPNINNKELSLFDLILATKTEKNK